MPSAPTDSLDSLYNPLQPLQLPTASTALPPVHDP